ncbi:MAG: hypothetical protein B7X41_15080 [Microbacterium sp. 14-71-5]|jgi:hypothetical protein|uniref:hypothetical protein n=1 Tax=Microbacterium sp. 13-71-7 TaxID=1970399 RepID=UPI000BD7C48A|nr:hypothetical protein [Microbacterium sp. 13-71-7]OZB80726.1 MAG: hypothetical protein B7X32_18725 [Microbacterium sp. 13-71-7]OZB84466.1 MAG: hypothetical protein B7X41_15080 [Microbacterium sp. 14-71-5]
MTDYSTEAQVRRISEESARKRSRMFVAFACIEGAMLAGAVIVVFVLKLVDPNVGVWILVALALVGSLVLSTMIIQQIRAQQQAIRDAGGTPFPGSTGPTF